MSSSCLRAYRPTMTQLVLQTEAHRLQSHCLVTLLLLDFRTSLYLSVSTLRNWIFYSSQRSQNFFITADSQHLDVFWFVDDKCDRNQSSFSFCQKCEVLCADCLSVVLQRMKHTEYMIDTCNKSVVFMFSQSFRRRKKQRWWQMTLKWNPEEPNNRGGDDDLHHHLHHSSEEAAALQQFWRTSRAEPAAPEPAAPERWRDKHGSVMTKTWWDENGCKC